ncbi:MAG: glutathione S-transferase N-terminal domain-containing protein [Phenylobacterium sp.]|uniref:glutathione S-transferase family protein n=1 Tax=Phenylobacterium sp. TaxID=1871053 RepID=UPI001A632BEB|nr:glutathione S-transferase N-terminal domain-containing protein [Phenylobacterium sp.]MBL8556768.1 glutathione S-transferase N-terminal domain-containing protein [Phenylobacterium sp.]
MIDLHFWPTPNGWKITIMLEETGLPYRLVPVDIGQGGQDTPQFRAISPNGRMPAIVDQDGPGGEPIGIFESGAILQYLGDKAGQFYPTDRRARTRVEEWLFWQCAGLGPMAGQAAHFRYREERDEYALNRYVNETRRLYGVLDKRLGEAEHVAGDYSIADMAIWPWTRGYKGLGIDPAEFPHFYRWFKQVGAREAVQKGSAIGKDAFAESQKRMIKQEVAR